MSILLIGEKSRYYSSQKPKFLQKEETQQYLKRKKTIQEQYRQDLLYQIRETNQRRWQDRQKDIELDRKYEKMFYDQLSHQQHRLQLEDKANLHNSKFYQYESTISSPTRQKKENPFTLPQIQSQNRFKTKDHRFDTESIHQSYHYRDKSMEKSKNRFRINTQNSAQLYRTSHQNSARFELESSEERHKQLHEDLQAKLRDVYSLMTQSVKTLHEAEQLQKIGSKLSPIHLGFQKKYKVRYPTYSNIFQNNPQNNKDFFKLPNITKSPNQLLLTNHQSQAEWRQWYAKEKLNQLQNHYRKQLNLNPNNIKLPHQRTGTPVFQSLPQF